MQQHHRITSDQWEALAAEPEFRALVQSRRRFVLPAVTMFSLFYLALPILAGFARPAMSQPVAGPLTPAYLYGLAIFVAGWLVLALYLRRARSFDLQAALMRKREAKEIRAE